MTRLLRTLLFSGLLLLTEPGHGQDHPKLPETKNSDDKDAVDPFSMDLDSLLKVKVTTASKFAENISDAPSSISVVTADELKRFGGMTVGEILAHVPWLTPTTSFVTDRNMVAAMGDQTRADGGHILILINGRPCREILQGGIITDILESFPVNVLERIEVIQGPGSVLYGSNAFSGVINLITKKKSDEVFHLRSSGGPPGSTAESADAYWDRGGLNVVAGAEYHRASPWQTLYNGLTYPGGPFVPLPATITDAGVGTFLGVEYKGLKFESSYTSMEAPSFAFTSIGDVRWKRGFFDLGYSKRVTSKWEATLDLTYTRNLLDVPQYPFVQRDSYESVLEWSNLFTLSNKDKLTAGAVVGHQHGLDQYVGVSPILTVANGSLDSEGFYAQYERKLTDNLKAVAGFQANKIGSHSVNVVPRGGIVWSPAERYSLKALYGGAYRAPSIDEILLNHPELKGNPHLMPEQVGTLSFEIGYQASHVEWSAGYFHSRQLHEIIADFTSYPGVYLNSPTALYFNGFEAQAKRYLRQDWFLVGSALYQSNHNGMGQTHISAVPNFGAKLGFSYQNKKGAELSVFDGYEGHIVGYATAPTPQPGAWHSVDAQARFDLSKRWSNDNRIGLAAFVHGNNLANYQRWLPDMSGSIPPGTVPFTRGRTVQFGIECWRKVE